MRLSWNEIRTRAANFAREWANEGYEKGQTQLFYRDFFEVFGMPVRRVASFESPVVGLGDRRGYLDLFWKGMLLVEQKSLGRDLARAHAQAMDYFPGLRDAELPRYILVSDFQSFELSDLETGEQTSFALAELPRNVEKFGFILGVERRSFEDQDPVTIRAAEQVGVIHDALKESGYEGHDLERFLVRLVFCLFADDTGIFEPRESFLDLLQSRTRADGSDLGGWLAKLFQVLNTPEEARSTKLDEDLARFPYVNGDLFEERLSIPSFDAPTRQLLIDACEFDWAGISPAIFGSLFQSVMLPEERRAKGAHYTTEANILKVLGPLCMDQMRAEFAQIKGRRDNRKRGLLEDFRRRLRELTFFDPACGCGNFLIIAYRELRQLEIDILAELRELAPTGQMELDPSMLSVVDVDQFYGIEIGEFPARIAATAMWMMDHIMNNRVSLELGRLYARIPLRKSAQIVHGDALELDWASILPPERCTYVLGNPPFVGAKYQTTEQRAQVRRIAGLGGTGGTLDYVAAWFIKAGRYMSDDAQVGFVATNSITQGEQVAQLWPILLEQCGLEITFAHRTFAWGSDARGKAHVHVVILGLAKTQHAPSQRRLFSYAGVAGEPYESSHAAISPYLFDASALVDPHIVVQEASRPINGLPRLIIGSKPIDGGHYIFSPAERDEFLRLEPGAAPLFRPFIGSREFIENQQRFILHLADADPELLRRLPRVRERIAAVRELRLRSRSKPTQRLAETPKLYHVK